ncbi:MAG: hypothetical protein JSV66_12620 [Trueperaceae bacterium]|nr:MAG: hypothetical protein JSV66_12620 [Trueperaceae bacterium]
MYASDRPPAWYRDAKWICGILLAPVLAAGVLYFSLAQLTSAPRALERLLELTLLPEGIGAEALKVRQDIDYAPDRPLQLLPGVAVSVAAGEVPELTVVAAQDLLAEALTEALLAGGAGELRAQISDPDLSEQLFQALQGSIPLLVRLQLEAAMLPVGLDNGSRLANWPLQAQQRPGEPVQPVVGVFLMVDPEQLEPLSRREIGALIVGLLAERLLERGLEATEEVVGNEDLLAVLSATVEAEIRSSVHELMRSLLAGRQQQLGLRLERAQAVLVGQAVDEAGIAGVVSAAELEGLSPQEANAVVLAALAERAYNGGAEVLATLLPDAQQAERVQRVEALVDSVTRAAQRRYLRLSWLFGILSLFLFSALVFFSAGLGRLVNPGIAVVSAASLGSFAFSRLSRALPGGELALPAGVRVEGTFGHLQGLVSFIGQSLPTDLLDVLVRNHLAVLAAGGGLIALAVLISVLNLVRPRRKPLL